ncbi:MAG: hypothetical protein ACXVH5_04700 [Ilumatobacteraceae bacterium]
MSMPTVPELMYGCWRRAWIEFSDGSIDASSRVVWLQTPSLMVDVRIAADRPHLAGRTGLGDCTLAELRAIAGSDASSGYTECTPVAVDADGLRTATACWHTRGHGVNFQPVSAFPEPGLMSWSDDGTVMTERAPSGAYVEQWHLVPGSRAPLTVIDAGDHRLYRAGDIAVLVRDRSIPVPRQARLLELLDSYEHDRPMIEGLLDCEFSVAEHNGSAWAITASTLPWREGDVLDVDLR